MSTTRETPDDAFPIASGFGAARRRDRERRVRARRRHRGAPRRIPHLRGRGRALRLYGAERRGLRLRRLRVGHPRRASGRSSHDWCARAGLHSRFRADEMWDTLAELYRARAIAEAKANAPLPKILPLDRHPAADAGGQRHQPVQPQLRILLRVRRGQDRRHRERSAAEVHERGDGARRPSTSPCGRAAGRAMVTFFGGETLMNFPVLKKTVAYARSRAAEVGKVIDFSLTTNATLLKPDVIDFLADERIGVTISIDGPQEIQDKFRVFHNGKGSYDVVAPKIKALLARHKSRPIGARVTLDPADAGRDEDLPASARRDGLLGGRLRPGHHGAAARSRHQRRGLRSLARPVPDAGAGLPAGRRSRIGTTDSRMCARRCRRSTRATPRRIRAVPVSGCWAWRPTATSRSAIASPARTRTRFGIDYRRCRSGEAGGVPRLAPHQSQDRLPDLLGAADLRRRLLSRGPYPLRNDDRARTCITVSGFAAGRTRAWKSTASWR